MSAEPPRIVVVAGPTASGKTRLAIELALRLGGEILNADSQQVYRGLDVGTAKPTPAERAAVPHHLLDLVEPGEPMDAARWASLADDVISSVTARGRLPIVVGGTGLYLRALLHGVVEAPGRDPELRARLEEEAALHGRAALHRRLATVDPGAAERIRENDLVRIVRALEIAAGGRTQTELFEAHRFAPRRYRFRLLVLDVARPELHRRIGERAEGMARGGMVEEARRVSERFREALPRLPMGYEDAVACARGDIGVDELATRIALQHRRYARRQVIWFRREQEAEWIPPPDDVPALASALRSAP